MGTLRLGFAGDVMLGRLVDERQRRRAVTAVWGDLLGDLRALDGLFVNLECCLSTRGRPWTRTRHPFHFRADPDWAVPALREAGVDYCSLANNHVLDFHEAALVDTLDALDDAGIARAGAGRSPAEAWRPAVVPVGGADGSFSVAVVSLTDNTPEFAVDDDAPGTAHVEIDPTDDATRAAVESALADARAADPDLLVASLHWGPNMRAEPPESFRAFARWLVDERGVDLVHGHSAHLFQGVEVRDGGVVCYDCGDFVDDYAVDSRLRNDRGFLFVLVVEDGAPAALRLVPIEIRDCAVHRAPAHVAEWSRDRMRELSAPFGTEFEREGAELVVRVS